MNFKNENQSMIFKKMNKIFLDWAKKEQIAHEELSNFLNSIKAVAQSKGIIELEKIAANNLGLVIKNDSKNFNKNQWQRYITPLISFIEKNTINKAEQDFILLVDDDADFVTFTKKLLEKEGFSVVVAPNGKRVLEMIYDFRPELILLDIHLPDTDGFTVLQQIQDKALKTFIPIVVMSADNCKENIIRSFELGAVDFIAKPIDRDIFVAIIKNRLAHKFAVEKSIVIDELTNVYNRTYMNTQLEQFIHQFRRSRVAFSVVVLDLDHFKKVNDRYGHITGDSVLREFAAIAKSLKRETDILCRFGGEEFVLLLPDTSKEGAKQVITRILISFSNKNFLAKGKSFRVTFSAGIVEVTNKNLDQEIIIDEADQALYFAKHAGRNQVVIFEPSMQGVKKRIRITIIIVDDDALTRQILMDFFTAWNPSEQFAIKVLEFNNGVSFLESDWYHPDEKFMILLDGIMPNMEGFEVLKRIRRDYSSQNVLISMLTGLTGEKNVIRFLEVGADDYIEKPFVPEVLAARVFQLIERVFA
jgi:two-component system cell cycle response regulator